MNLEKFRLSWMLFLAAFGCSLVDEVSARLMTVDAQSWANLTISEKLPEIWGILLPAIGICLVIMALHENSLHR